MNVAFGIFCLAWFGFCLAGAVHAWVESEHAVRRSTGDTLLPETELSTRYTVFTWDES